LYLARYKGEKPVAFTPHVFEVHGNSFYMHCSDEEVEHSKQFYPCPKLIEVTDRINHVPLCAECSRPMKPHSMFFDEKYSEHYYRKKSVDDYVEEADCLIVVGTAL
jgi:NAD-dependent SIR2 family protein deacetylase